MSFFQKIKGGISSLSGIARVTLSAEAFEKVLKDLNDVTINKLRTDAVDAEVSVSGLAVSYKLRLVATDTGIYYDTYVLNTDPKAAKAACEKVGVKCQDVKPNGIVITGVIPKDKANTSGLLKCVLQDLIGSINSAIIDIRPTNAQLNARRFDCESLEKEFMGMPGFTLKDEHGYINFIYEPDANMALRRTMYVRIEPTIITIGGGQTTLEKVRFGKASAAVRKFNESSTCVKAFCDSEYSLYFQTKIKLEDFTEATLASKPLQEAKRIFSETLSAWKVLLPSMGSNLRWFEKAQVLKLAKSLPGYAKEDGGDVRLDLPVKEDFTHPSFIWIYIYDDKIMFDSGLNDFSDFTKGLDLAKAVANFNDKSRAEAKIDMEGKNIRVNTVVKRSLLPDDLSESKLNEVLSKEVDRHIRELRRLADVCGIPYFVVNSDIVALALKSIGYNEIKKHATRWVSGKRAYCILDVSSSMEAEMKLTRHYEGTTSSPETSAIIEGINKKGHGAFTAKYDSGGDGGFQIRIDSPKKEMTSFSQLTDYLRELTEMSDTMDSDVYNANNKIYACRKEEEAERERQEEEQRRREEEQRKLNSEYWMELNTGSTVRFIKRTFNEWFPYLRLGVYMAKTGKAADKRGETISSYDLNTTMGEIRTFRSSGRVTIYGKSTPADIEKIFRQETGLVVKVCYTDPHNDRFYISKTNEFYKQSIVEISNYMENNGYYYNVWR